MSRSRREDILDAEVLLVVKRPDRGLFGWVMLVCYGVLYSLMVSKELINSTSWGGLETLGVIVLALYFLSLFWAFNFNPVIFTEKGITQKRARSLYWHEIDRYKWLAISNSKDYFRIKFVSSKKRLWLTSDTIFGFGRFHRSKKEELDKVFQQKGLREIV